MEQEIEVSETQNTQEVAETKEGEETTSINKMELSEEELVDLKKKADASSQNFERLKKTEEALKEAREKIKQLTPDSSQQDNLSNKDLLYLAKADIHPDDIDDLLDEARLRKWDVQKTHQYLKPILDTREEERKTAAATHTKGGARATSKVTGEDLLQKAERTGEVPDDEEGMGKLFLAKLARKLPKRNA